MIRALAASILAIISTQAAVDWQPSFELVQPELFGAPGGNTNAWADIDNDGDLDYFVGFRGRSSRLYRNDNGRFLELAVLATRTSEVRSAAWGDFNADGHVDLYVGFADPGVSSQVFRNEGNGKRFVEVSEAIGLAIAGVSRQAAWIDYDGDGDLDLFTANQEGDANGLYRQHRGTFEDVAAALGVAGTPRPKADGGVGPSLADFDGDGDFDLFVANYGPSALYRNDDGRVFVDVARERGIDLRGHAVTSAWGDLDNDGFPELYVANFLAGEPRYRDALFWNNRGTFVEMLPGPLLAHDATHGVRFVDFDQGGRLDLSLTNNDARGGGHPLWRNTAAVRGRSIAIDVVDRSARRTRAGSEVRAYRTGTRQLLSTALVDSGSGYCSQSEMPVHLGIGDAWKGNIDIEIITLLGGARRVSLVRDVNPDQYRGRSLRIISIG